VKEWFRKNRMPYPQIFAVDMGSETGIIANKKKKGKMINLRARHLEQKLPHYLPEDVYYDRNMYKDAEKILDTLDFKDVWNSDNFLGQQLAFDIDPENIRCACKKKFPHFCKRCMPKTVENALLIYDIMKERFSRVGIVYSGRGMHVHVFDRESCGLTVKERDEINKKVLKYAIDPWVSRGYIRLMRLPYSLNGLVSRIVLPLSVRDAERFDPVTSTETIPRFYSH
jgi:hypothetical protein